MLKDYHRALEAEVKAEGRVEQFWMCGSRRLHPWM
jgi:hypothetical protein